MNESLAMHRLHITSGLLCVFAVIPGVSRANVMFSNFSSTSGLTLNGDANVVGDRLRLTPAEYLQRGAAWSTAREGVGDGFDTVFRFRITNPAGFFNDFGGEPGADGFAFVIQAIGPTALGDYGGSLGYGEEPGGSQPGIARSAAVEFDTWFNPPTETADPNGNHISVHTRGLLANNAHESFSLGSTTTIPNLSDGAFHTARIAYTPGSLSVYLDDLLNPRLVVPLDLSSTLGLDDGRAWVGFTSGTFNAWQNHDIHDWSLTVTPAAVPEPSTFAMGCIGGLLALGCFWRLKRAAS
jgi:hypothetical protein